MREGEAVLDYRGAEKRLLTWRLQAVDEILVSRGTTGVLWLAEDAASPRDVGYTLAFVKNEALYVVNLVTAVDRRFVDKEEVFALLGTLRKKLAPVLQQIAQAEQDHPAEVNDEAISGRF